MAQTVSLLLSAQGRSGLEEVVEDRRRPVKHVQRAQIVLLSTDRLPVLEIAKRVGISLPMVWRWQQRYAEEGLDGLLRDKTRPPGIPPTPQAKVHAVVERTLREPPGAVTHWTGRAMAKAMGLSLRTVQRIWAAHKLQPHRIRTFKRSTDPDFAARCLIPGFDGAIFSHEWKDALWDRFTMGAPRRQRQSVERYSIVKRA